MLEHITIKGQISGHRLNNAPNHSHERSMMRPHLFYTFSSVLFFSQWLNINFNLNEVNIVKGMPTSIYVVFLFFFNLLHGHFCVRYCATQWLNNIDFLGPTKRLLYSRFYQRVYSWLGNSGINKPVGTVILGNVVYLSSPEVIYCHFMFKTVTAPLY